MANNLPISLVGSAPPSYSAIFCEKLNKLDAKIRETVYAIFQLIQNFFSRCCHFLRDMIWPYKNTENSNATALVVYNEPNSYIGDKPAAVINYGFVPYMLAMTSNSFIGSVITSETIKSSKDGDEIDRLVYRAFTTFALSGLNHYTDKQAENYLHAASVFINSEALQKVFLDLPVISTINDKVHSSCRDLREKVALPIAGMGVDFIMNKGKSAIENRLIKSPVGEFIGCLVEYQCEDVLKKTSNKVANFVVDGTINFAKFGIQLYYINKTLTASFSKHPLLGAAQFVLLGGLSQNILQLSLRVTGAAILLRTGSTRLPIAMLFVIKVIETFINVRAKHLKKIKRIDPFFQLVNYWKEKKVAPLQATPTSEELIDKDWADHNPSTFI